MTTETKVFKDTPEQAAFLDALANSAGHIALIARAGTGKTSTILRGVSVLRQAFPYQEVVVCAYNKSIADEVAEKLKGDGHELAWKEEGGRKYAPRVAAATLHSLGFSLIRTMFRDIKVDEDKVKKIIEGYKPRKDPRTGEDLHLHANGRIYQEYPGQIAALVGYAKGAGFGFFNDLPIGSKDAWYALADHYDVNGLDDTSEMDEVVEAAQHVYRQSLEDTATIDFDDMILFPLVKNIVVKYGKDHIFLDEAQDLSRARQALARKMLKPRTGRMYIVGDDRQAIYGFSGADAAALDNLINGLGATRMPLTVTWRCPTSVVKLAQTLVPDIKAAPSAAEGRIDRITEKQFDELELTAADAILCRNTAPLISCAYKLIRKGVPCKVEGRSIGQGLEKLVTRWKVKTIDALLNKLELYRDREVQKAMAKGSESKAEEVNDRVDTLKEICNAVIAMNKQSVDDVRAFIQGLFADSAENVLTLATYHRSKGREWDRVILWEHAARCPSRAARQQWQFQQEENLAYVAYTRAKQNLVFVG
jgi:DNA helicase II / ATP-dependent DNA helicase PcrA